MSAVEKLLEIARNEIGYLEKETNSNLDDKVANAGYNNYTKYASDLDKTIIYNGKKNGYSWCDVFVDWCFVTSFGLKMALKLTHQASKGHGAGCTYSAKCYINNGRFYKTDPQPGDQIFFTKDGGKNYYHTGLVEAVANGRVYTIEGNTSSKIGVVENGGAVASKSYPLNYDKIGGYGRPNYDLIDKANKPETTIPKTGKVTAFVLNIRSGPSTKDKVIGWLKKDSMLTITSVSNDKKWYQIKSNNSKSGWVSAKHVKVITSVINVVYKTTTTALNLRAGRGTTYNRLAVIPANSRVEVSDLQANWYKVKYNNIEGYCDANYLK